MNIIEQLEAEQVAKLAANDRSRNSSRATRSIVNVKVKEGERTRVQAYEGVCIARNGGGLNESFTVRKISYGEGVERVFPIYSPMIDSIKVVRRGKVRRAKLYYLRDRRGKSARIAEKMESAGGQGRARGGEGRARKAAKARRQEPKDKARSRRAKKRPRCQASLSGRVQHPAMAERIAEGRKRVPQKEFVGWASDFAPRPVALANISSTSCAWRIRG